jgi:hypothetical protein
MLWFLNNRWIVYGTSAFAITLGLFIWLQVHDANQRKLGEQRCQMAVAAALAKGEALQAAAVKAAQEAAQREVEHVQANSKIIGDKNAELERRIAALSVRPSVHNPTVSETDNHPGTTAGTSPPIGLLAGPLATAATGCAADYADVAAKLEAIGALTK